MTTQEGPPSVGDFSQLSDGPELLHKSGGSLALEAHAHKISQQQTVINAALCAIMLLFMVAVSFGAVLLYLLVKHPSWNIHWHASILVATFILPPTVALVALMRSVYVARANSEDRDYTPILSFGKEAAEAIFSALKK